MWVSSQMGMQRSTPRRRAHSSLTRVACASRNSGILNRIHAVKCAFILHMSELRTVSLG